MLKENSKIKKIVLAYSGGLDTSVILKWLQDNYKCDVVTFTADIGQGEEVEQHPEDRRPTLLCARDERAPQGDRKGGG